MRLREHTCSEAHSRAFIIHSSPPQGKEGSPPARMMRVLEQRAVRCLSTSLPTVHTPSFLIAQQHHVCIQGSGHELVQAFLATCRALGNTHCTALHSLDLLATEKPSAIPHSIRPHRP